MNARGLFKTNILSSEARTSETRSVDDDLRWIQRGGTDDGLLGGAYEICLMAPRGQGPPAVP